MEIKEILGQVNTIFCEVFDDSELKINEKTTAMEVDDWDSLTHIQLVVAIEKQFKIRFNSSEVNNWKNVGQICLAIKSKI